MQGDTYCCCWTCRSFDIVDEENMKAWLNAHWGHAALLREDLGNGEYSTLHLTNQKEKV